MLRRWNGLVILNEPRRPLALLALLALACDLRASHKPQQDVAAPQDAAPSGASAERPPEADSAAPPPALVDRGLFEDLDERVTTECPAWTGAGPYLPVRFEGSPHRWRALAGVAICHDEEARAPGPAFPSEALAASDRDADGIPDAVDILRGAKKAALNGAAYRSVYRELPYPGGDVPRDEGVCTDVVVRALRNAGFDLQALLSEDIAAHPARYPSVKKPDSNIDHRRVRTLLPYFRAHFPNLPVDATDTAHPYLPGDVVFMDTMGDKQPEHMGIVSDRVGPSGLPLIVNNWNDGWTTREMDLLAKVPVTDRFRVARALSPAPTAEAGLHGLLARRGITPPEASRQLVLVTTPLWNSSGGELRRYRRAASTDPWQPVGRPLPVRIGSAGLGQGRGLHGPEACSDAPDKREGDKRAPTGLFALGTAFGRAPAAPFAPGTWPYRATTPNDRFVDDPASPHYNTWQVQEPGSAPRWTSAERLTMYSLGLVVEHNTQSPVPGGGSAIFIHPWRSPAHPTVGCTALDERRLVELLGWLDPAARPVLVQVAGTLL